MCGDRGRVCWQIVSLQIYAGRAVFITIASLSHFVRYVLVDCARRGTTALFPHHEARARVFQCRFELRGRCSSGARPCYEYRTHLISSIFTQLCMTFTSPSKFYFINYSHIHIIDSIFKGFRIRNYQAMHGVHVCIRYWLTRLGGIFNGCEGGIQFVEIC